MDFGTANQLAFCLLAFGVRRISKSQLDGVGDPKFAWLGSRGFTDCVNFGYGSVNRLDTRPLRDLHLFCRGYRTCSAGFERPDVLHERIS